jgi:hypothetical protein
VTICEDIKDVQETADSLGLEFSADILCHAYTTQYQLFSDKRCRQDDYVVEKMNEVIEAMVNHYGRPGGGRVNGHHYD